PKVMHEESEMSRLLLQRIAAGDTEAFCALYRRYGPRVTAIVRTRVAERQLVEELVQDIFVAAWQSAQGYRSDLGDPEPWLLGITRHKLQDHWRRLRRIAETVGVPSTSPVPAPAPAPPEARVSIAQALETLSPDQRQVIELIYASGLTFRETSRVLGLSIGTVKSRANAALGRMKAFLSGATRS